MGWELTITVMGTIASVASLLISQPNWKSRAIHFSYTAIIVAIMVFMTSRLVEEAAEVEKANQRIATIESIQRQAKALLSTIPTYTDSDGVNRGTVLKVLAFLERYHPELPVTFGKVQELADGVGLTERAKPYFEGGSEHSKSLRQAGTAVREIVEGLAIGAK